MSLPHQTNVGQVFNLTVIILVALAQTGYKPILPAQQGRTERQTQLLSMLGRTEGPQGRVRSQAGFDRSVLDIMDDPLPAHPYRAPSGHGTPVARQLFPH